MCDYFQNKCYDEFDYKDNAEKKIVTTNLSLSMLSNKSFKSKQYA